MGVINISSFLIPNRFVCINIVPASISQHAQNVANIRVQFNLNAKKRILIFVLSNSV